ncbi:tetratricopeptide repeat (TPR)-like superfamily protein [Artemisia annua]|uniref:Tetratricopeptide repeat (TPR)-like superfamily protein n=1 Tax=Artemisia annua TaxID=35608 RepID=A0A2U1NYR2_ARTAN|nr:tetratricopeptide repeat (TPR)-like superfamily protein [Artemisia annua]
MPIKNVVSWIAMVSAYVENWDIGNARKVFDEMPERNVALWNAMIMGYMREKSGVDKGFELFGLMPERNAVMYAYVITGFVRSARVDKAREVYDGMCREWRDPFCSNALMNGYLKMGRLEDAVRVYEEMMVKNVVSWSTMVDGYMKASCFEDGFGQNGYGKEALELQWALMGRASGWSLIILRFLALESLDSLVLDA